LVLMDCCAGRSSNITLRNKGITLPGKIATYSRRSISI
jgi:hypothetical protein